MRALKINALVNGLLKEMDGLTDGLTLTGPRASERERTLCLTHRQFPKELEGSLRTRRRVYLQKSKSGMT